MLPDLLGLFNQNFAGVTRCFVVGACSHACYGSFETSHPALLPFLNCMPARLSLAAPRRPAAIAAALWKGCEALPPSTRAAAATCYQVGFVGTDSSTPHWSDKHAGTVL